MSARVEVLVLGPLQATVDGHPVDLRGPRQRAVLAALTLASPRMTTVDQIMADVWPDGHEPGVGTLHYYVSQLRGALEPGRARTEAPTVLVRQGPGYALRLPADAVDAQRFTRLVAAGSRAMADGRPDAVEVLEQALGLWRGPAYSDVADAPFVAAELGRLDELRLAATEDLIEARLRAGPAAAVVAAAQEHTARHPLRERGWELLVLALYRAGRQAEALDAVGTVRRLLAEELGLDPGPGLVRVEAAVRAQSAAAGGPATGAVAAAVESPGRSPIPVGLTELLGRDDLIADLTAEVAAHRLVTLTGPGGVGKTRLALEVARRCVDIDVALVELATLADPDLLATTVAAALGAPTDDLAALLGDRRVLVVLDNCEHLLDAVCGLVAPLLGRCPGLRVLATSRATLDLPGERVREVPPLDPDGAARLFVDRAGAGWRPAAAEQDAVARICAQLDGLPLAVELAAARMRVLSADQLATALDGSRLALLTDGLGGAPVHQRGLEATAQWSYAGLPEPQARLFRRLSVFAGSFDADGATALAGETLAATVPLLGGLVRHSLVATVPGAGPRRFRMLRTLREFAGLRATPDERADAARAHRHHALAGAVAAEREIRGPGAGEAMARLRRDRPEHRAALASALHTGDSPTATALAAALSWFWYRDGAIAEGLRFAADALALPGPVDDLTRSRVLHGVGGLRYLGGDPAGAATALTGAVALAGRARDPAARAHSAAWLAHMDTFTRPAAAALAAAEAAAAVDTEPGVHAEALMIAGMARRRTGLGPARPVLREAVDVAEAAGHGWAVVSSTWALMKAAVDDGDPDAALAAAARMRGPLAADGDVTSWLVLVHTTAGVLAGAGRPAQAATLLGAVHALGDRVGFHPERMDPADGHREAAAVRAALDPAEFARHEAAGRELGRAEVDALLADLLG